MFTKHAHRVLLYISINIPHFIYSEVSDVSNCISFSFAIPLATTLTADDDDEDDDEEDDDEEEEEEEAM